MDLTHVRDMLSVELTAYPWVPRFDLVDESEWYLGCRTSLGDGTTVSHRRPMDGEGGIICLDCYKVVVLPRGLAVASPSSIRQWAENIANRWGNRKAVLVPAQKEGGS